MYKQGTIYLLTILAVGLTGCYKKETPIERYLRFSPINVSAETTQVIYYETFGMADFAESAIFKIPEHIGDEIIQTCLASGFKLGKFNEDEFLDQARNKPVQFEAISFALRHSNIAYRELNIRKHQVCSYRNANSAYVEVMDNYVFFAHYVP